MKKFVIISICILSLCATSVEAATFGPKFRAKPSYNYRFRKPPQKKPQHRYRTRRAQPFTHRAFAVPDSTAYYMNSNKQSLWGTSYRTTHPKKTRKR